MEKARIAVFGGVPPRLRSGQVLQRNAQAYIPRKGLTSEMAADIRAVFYARHWQETEELLALAVQKHAKTASDLADWMEENIPGGLTIFSFPEKHRRLRTTNGLERLNCEIRRRTRVAVLFPNTTSSFCLATALSWKLARSV